MTDYFIELYDASTNELIKEAITFKGDFNMAKEYAFCIAHRTTLGEVAIMIWDLTDYQNRKDPLIHIDISFYG